MRYLCLASDKAGLEPCSSNRGLSTLKEECPLMSTPLGWATATPTATGSYRDRLTQVYLHLAQMMHASMQTLLLMS